jgi:hypothetical protein
LKKEFRCILYEFKDLDTGTEKRKEERRKSRYFCGFLAFGNMKENIR